MMVMRSALVMDTVWLLHFSASCTRSWAASPVSQIPFASFRSRSGAAHDFTAATPLCRRVEQTGEHQRGHSSGSFSVLQFHSSGRVLYPPFSSTLTKQRTPPLSTGSHFSTVASRRGCREDLQVAIRRRGAAPVNELVAVMPCIGGDANEESCRTCACET
jgi:hypothetical protein